MCITRSRVKNGFGIIEVLVSMSIMSFVIVTLFSLANATFLSWGNAKSKAIAQGILQDKIESIHNKRDTNVLGGAPWDDGITEAGFSENNIRINGKNFSVITTIDDDSTDDRLPAEAEDGSRKIIKVVVGWTERELAPDLTDVEEERFIYVFADRYIESYTYITDWRPKY